MYIDANLLYLWASTESLACDVIQMWKGHPDCYMNKLEGVLNTPVDRDFGYFVEVDLLCPDEKKTKNKKFSILSRVKS